MENNIAARLEQIEERISAACDRAGRKRQEITLMGVSKFHDLEAVEEAYKAGLRLFGESRVQEGREKFDKFREVHGKDSAKVHLIGSLQRNKAKLAASFFDCIQSVDRLSLIDELGDRTAGRESPLMILLELHTGEDSKAGFPDMDSLFGAAERVLSFPGLKPSGLMTMAPYTDDTAVIRSSFRTLKKAGEELEKRFPADWSCLSMGMTGDLEIAIEEGSTLLRIGTAIFGERIRD